MGEDFNIGHFCLVVLPTIYKQVNTLPLPSLATPVVASVTSPDTGKGHHQSLGGFIIH